MYIYEFGAAGPTVDGEKVHIDNQGNITVNPLIGKITVNSETEYSLTMAGGYGVIRDVVGGPYPKTAAFTLTGNMPRIKACTLWFGNNDVQVFFDKDTDGDGVSNFSDPFPENENKNNVTQPPVITLNGDNPLNVELGSVYEDPELQPQMR